MLLFLSGAACSAYGQVMESFEDVAIGQMPPTGWLKWQEAGGRGWSNSWAGRRPMPGWMSGTNTVPPDPDAGSRMAYVTYTDGGAKTNDLWLITPELRGVVVTSSVSFWYRSCYSNFADNLYVMISTNPAAYRKSDFTIEAAHLYFPRGYPPATGPGKFDYPEWTNVVVNIGALVPAGAVIRVAFREFHGNNWYDVRANELDVIKSDLWSAPIPSIRAVRMRDPTTVEVDYTIFAGYPAGTCRINWGPSANHDVPYGHHSIEVSPGTGTCVISNVQASANLYIQASVKHTKGMYYSDEERVVYAGDADGEGYLFESFEDVPIGQMPPAGWLKWQEAGGRGWSNSWAGRRPMPGWMSGTNTVPPAEGAGSRMAYVTYTDGGAKTNDLWLISPPLKDIPPDYDVSFWYRSCFSNFADNLYLMVSTDENAYRKSDFTIEAAHLYFPRGYPGPLGQPKKDYPEWTNVVTDIGALVQEGAEIRIAFREYHNNNWYDVRANELDVISAGRRPRAALYFDGVDDQIVLPLTNTPAEYTIEAWVNPQATGAQNLIVRSHTNPLTAFSQQLRINSAGQFEHYINDGIAKTVTGSTTVQAGKWYHVAGTAKNGGTLNLIVNGQEEGPPVSIGTMLLTGMTNVFLGVGMPGSYANYNGLLDEVRFWKKVRTTNEIIDTMNVYLRGVETNLVACYRMDRTFGSDMHDSSAAAHDAWFAPATSSRVWREAGDEFDGVDDVLTNSAAATANYTIEAWVRTEKSGAQNIMVFTDGNPLSSYNHQLRINSANRPEFYSYDGSVRLVTGTTVLQPNTWYHVAGTSANGGTMRLFVNGIEENSGLAGNTLWGTYREYQIGAATGGGSTWFKGWIRDVSIANSVKTGADFLAQINPLLDTNQSPQWVAGGAPLGDAIASQHWKNRGIWELRPAATASRGLRISGAGVSGDTNFFVFGDNGLSGGTNADLSAGISASRQNRIWHFDFHGATQQTANLYFDPVAGGSSVLLSSTNDYQLLRRDSTSGNFSATRTTADAISGSEVAFNAVALNEGYYTLGVAPPPPPDPLPATNITAHTFYANWSAVPTVSGYQLDVSSSVTFSGFVSGYNSLAISNVVTAWVTNLNPGVTYYYRLRSVRDGATSTNSASTSLVTLAEGAIGIDPETLNFSGTYGTSPDAQIFVLTNSGQTAYSFSNNVTYSDGATGWLLAQAGSVDAVDFVTRTATVSSVSLNAGTHTATNSILSATATNSPQHQIVTLTISKADQTITFPAVGDRLTMDTVGLSATASSGLEVTFAVASGSASISGGTNLSFSGAGTVRITAAQAGNTNWNAAATVTNTFEVTKTVAPVSLSNTNQMYDGTARIVTATTVPSGLTVNITYDGSSAAPTNPGTYAVSAIVNEIMYQGASSGTLTIAKGDQTTMFPNIGNQETTNVVTLTATASSGLSVTNFSIVSGPALVDGSMLTFTNSGNVVLSALQDGDSNWNASPSTNSTFDVTKAVASVSLSNTNQTYDGAAKSVTVTTVPTNQTVAVTYDSSATIPSNAASYVVVAIVNEPMYQGGTTGTLTIAKADQTTTFPTIGNQETTNVVTLTATASSGLSVTNFSVVSGPAVVSGSSVSFTNSGAVVLSALQAGDSNWNVSPATNITFNVAKATASVSLSNTNQTYDGSAKSVAVTTAPTNQTVVVTYDGGATIPSNAASYVVIATVNEAMYQGGTTGTLTIAKANQAVAFTNPGDQLTTNMVTLSATASSSLSVTNFSVVSGPAVVGGASLTFTNSGTVVLRATQDGDGNWNAESTNITFDVTKAMAMLSLSNTNQTYDGTAKSVTVTTAPTNQTVVVTYDGGATIPSNAASYVVIATVNEPMYQGGTTGTLTVIKADQTISFPAIGTQGVTNRVGLSATATSSLNVSFSVASGPASINSSTNLSFSNIGPGSLLATQGGNGNWNAAPTMTNAFDVIGVITNVMPASGTLYGGTQVTISGLWLGNGTDITNVTLCDVAATIVTQSIHSVTVTSGALAVETNADVLVQSAGYGTVTLIDGFTYQPVPPPPEALSAVDIEADRFTARWTTAESATNYLIDVAQTNAFTAFTGSYNNRGFGDVTAGLVTGLTDGVTYYYRVRAQNMYGSSTNSNPIEVPVSTNTPYIQYEETNGVVSAGSSDVIDMAQLFHGSGMSYNVVSNSNPALVSAAFSGTDLIFNYTAGMIGTAHITIRVTDSNGFWVETTLTVAVAPEPSLMLSAITLNPQNGLYEQTATVSNTSPTLAANAVTLTVTNLSAGSSLYNSTGTDEYGNPEILWIGTLAPLTAMDFTLQYYTATRGTVPSATVQASLSLEAPATGISGTAFNLSGTPQNIGGTQSFLIEFGATPGRTYYIQYTAALTSGWKTVQPSIVAPVNRIQWIDSGPPGTESAPGTVPGRFYRVIETTQ